MSNNSEDHENDENSADVIFIFTQKYTKRSSLVKNIKSTGKTNSLKKKQNFVMSFYN